MKIKAELSRAILEISTELSSRFPLTPKSNSACFEVIFPCEVVFNWRSSFVVGHLLLKVVSILRVSKIWIHHLSLSCKFEYDPISGNWDIGLSSTGGHLHLKHLQTLVWSPKANYKIWVWSHQWLLRYSTFYILRSSSIWGHLHLKLL